MPKGKVKWFNEKKGYGSITPDDAGDDCFVHHTGIEGGRFKTLAEGESVEFEIEKDNKGRSKAIKVRKL